MSLVGSDCADFPSMDDLLTKDTLQVVHVDPGFGAYGCGKFPTSHWEFGTSLEAVRTRRTQIMDANALSFGHHTSLNKKQTIALNRLASLSGPHAEELEIINVTWHPTWEAADLLLANPDFKKLVQSFEQSHKKNVPFLHQRSPAADTNVDDLTCQGYKGSTNHLQRHCLTTQGHPMRNKAYFDPETSNPQADILPNPSVPLETATAQHAHILTRLKPAAQETQTGIIK
eukprot:287791-Pelagomonas_calceolata.AAC.1